MPVLIKDLGAIAFTCDQICQTAAGPRKPFSLDLNNNRIISRTSGENYFLN